MVRVMLALVVLLHGTGMRSLAWAEGFNIGDACTTAGALQTKNDTAGAYSLVCDGAHWQLSLTHEKTGNIGIGTTTPAYALDTAGIAHASTALVVGSEVGGYVGSGYHRAQIIATGAQAPLMLAGGDTTIEIWKDTTPTHAISLGMAKPGGTLTNSFVLSTNDGTGWAESLRIFNPGNSAATSSPQVLLNYGNAGTGTDFTGWQNGTQMMSFGFNSEGEFEGTAGAPNGREIYFYDRVAGAVRGGFSSSGNFYVGPSGTVYGMRVSQPASGTGVTVDTSNNVGIGDSTPDHRLDVAGNIGLNASSYINFGDTDGTTGYGLRDNAGTVECKNSGGAWAACAGGGGTPALSAITAATATNTIDSLNYAQVWKWDTLAGGTGLALSAASTAAASNTQKVLSVATSGANGTATQTTYGAYLTNTHTGTASTNVGLYASASGGSNNYAALFPAGNVGLGTTTPDAPLQIYATTSSYTPALWVSDLNSTLGGALYFEWRGGAVNNKLHSFVADSNGMSFYRMNDAGSAFVNATPDLVISPLGQIGIATSTPVTTLQVAAAPSARTDVTGTVAANAIALSSSYTVNTYVPGLVWFTTNNSATKPKAGLWELQTAAGSYLELGTSNDYTAGITSTVTIDPSGNVGIGDTTPDHKLDAAGNIGLNASSYINFGDTDGTTGYGLRDNAGTVECKNSGGAWAACAGGSVAGATTQIQFNDSGALGGDADFVWDKTANALTVTGDINYTGQIADTSDRRMKENIRALPSGQLEKLMSLQGVSFTMKGRSETELGLIAQDVEAVYPELVRTTAAGTKTLNYLGLIAPLIEAIEEQQAEIRDLQDSNRQQDRCPSLPKRRITSHFND